MVSVGGDITTPQLWVHQHDQGRYFLNISTNSLLGLDRWTRLRASFVRATQ